MTAWDELKVVLLRLRDEQPSVMVSGPDPGRDDGRQPPFGIWLEPFAEAVARDLHERFGADVDLRVGALPYPPGRRPDWAPDLTARAGLLDPRDVAVGLDGPAVVRSGHTVLHGLLLDNLTDRPLQVVTNGHVLALVVDPREDQVVGGFSGAERLPLITFDVPACQAGRIPLLIGTASFRASLGYAVPPGSWGIEATLTFATAGEEDQIRRTPVLPLEIT